MPTVETIVGEKFIPGMLDHYLAEVAYSGQQTDIPLDPNRPDNLWAPVAEDRGAHGMFGTRARTSSIQLWASMHRGWLTLAGLGMLLGWARKQFLADRLERDKWSRDREELT